MTLDHYRLHQTRALAALDEYMLVRDGLANRKDEIARSLRRTALHEMRHAVKEMKRAEGMLDKRSAKVLQRIRAEASELAA